jgi:hypothetical protein
MAVMVIGIFTEIGCGLQSRPVKKERSGGAVPGAESVLDQARAPNQPGFQAVGYQWVIREAKPRTDSHPGSAWSLGASVSPRVVVDAQSAVVLDPILWPEPEDGMLVVQIRNLRFADWSARCIRADESSEESLPARRVEWDPESESGVIPLSDAFGSRGEKRDPASSCHISVRFESSGAAKSFQLSLRVMSGLPVPEPSESKTFPLSSEWLLREETWKNHGLRPLKITLDAKPQLLLSNWIEARWFSYVRSRNERTLNKSDGFRLSETSSLALQARYFSMGQWSSWLALPQTLAWPAGGELVVQYRLVAAPGAPICSWNDRNVEHLMLGIFVGLQVRPYQRTLQGHVEWRAHLEDPTLALEGGVTRQTEKRWVQEWADTRPGVSTSSFDCQGWLP